MCRYAFKRYKLTYACFQCQVGFKRPNLFDVEPKRYMSLLKENGSISNQSKDFHCPNCAGEMANLGRDLRLPRKTQNEQWQCIQYLYDNEYNIYSCGCSGIGFVPHKMTDAIALVAEYKERDRINESKQQQELRFNALKKAKIKRDKHKAEVKKQQKYLDEEKGK
jgi:hypothetical protein